MLRFDFQVTEEARLKYEIDSSLFSINGDIIIANLREARLLAAKINNKRKSENIRNKLVTPGQINAAGLLHEIFHYIISIYENNENNGVFSKAVQQLQNEFGVEVFESILKKFVIDFPPPDVYKKNLSMYDYLRGFTGNKSNKEIILEELILLDVSNLNPATESLEELFSDKKLKKQTLYSKLIKASDSFFRNEKPFGSENLPLTEFIKKPILSNPYDLDGQLNFIAEKWGVYISDKFGKRLLLSKDLFAEDAKLFFIGGFKKETPPVPSYQFDAEYFKSLQDKIKAGQILSEEESLYYYEEKEQFTEDVDWMPKVVMIAKNIFVWLDQLSKKYKRSISKLDQIPDEELNDLARWNFTALWLIGIWERSTASKKIKQLTGNPEAAPSAYSLFDYVVAEELGGEAAFENLKHRAWLRGIRLASDMVPNHMGILSKWVLEKPEYFIQSDFPPYPNYTFKGENLSTDPRIEVRIEDKYYSREDAAVVFQRKDTATGTVKYFFHGNDGTSMPWNDTSQLNLLNPEVRESLIQTIMHVAGKTPIIRFDAAMTLTKKHYARLWFPQPGTGGAIPSRSDYSMSRSEFDRAMPNEFWREVVDRINKEMPSTLLLAEAFWLMEGYFVRTLGMHRVYNSAFMHMMMKEENNKYRELIKNTLEFNPEILKRYVNFMSNPDEETAINQFGDGDKYFGVAAMMLTLPGLPMFGHGQVEGYKEKYGMEYKRSYYDEHPNNELINRHERELFPLMQKRHLFSQVEHFELYDFFDDRGFINENVIAFSNKSGNEQVLIIYNNSYDKCSGTISHSALKINFDNEQNFRSKSISEALKLKGEGKYFYRYKDHRSKLEFLVSGEKIVQEGFHFELNGYQYYVLLNFNEIYDQDGIFERLYYRLSGIGVHSIEAELNEMNLVPVHEAFEKLLRPALLEKVHNYITTPGKETALPEELPRALSSAAENLCTFLSVGRDNELILKELKNDLAALISFNEFNNKLYNRKNCPKWFKEFISDLPATKNTKTTSIDKLLIPVILFYILYNSNPYNRNYFDILNTYILLQKCYGYLSVPLNELYSKIYLTKNLISPEKIHLWKENEFSEIDNEQLVIFISDLFFGKDIAAYLGLHEFEGTSYFHKESFELILGWFCLLSVKEIFKGNPGTEKETLNKLKLYYQLFETLKEKAAESGYSVVKLKELLLNTNGKTKNLLSTKKQKN